MSDNEIKRLGNFAPAPRLGTLLLNNNAVAKIDGDLGAQLPNLHTLVLTGNRVESLEEVGRLASCAKLSLLSLAENPVQRYAHYRAYAIAKLPALKVLDYKKVKPAERAAAAALFPADGESTADLTKLAPKPAAVAAPPRAPARPPGLSNLTEEQKAAIRTAVANAKTPQEVDDLERQLRELQEQVLGLIDDGHAAAEGHGHPAAQLDMEKLLEGKGTRYAP